MSRPAITPQTATPQTNALAAAASKLCAPADRIIAVRRYLRAHEAHAEAVAAAAVLKEKIEAEEARVRLFLAPGEFALLPRPLDDAHAGAEVRDAADNLVADLDDKKVAALLRRHKDARDVVVVEKIDVAKLRAFFAAGPAGEAIGQKWPRRPGGLSRVLPVTVKAAQKLAKQNGAE